MNNKYSGYIFDLDGTLAESKSPVGVRMVVLLKRLLDISVVGVITGGKFGQIKTQLIDKMGKCQNFKKLILLSNSGGKCVRYGGGVWRRVYEERFTTYQECEIIEAIKESVRLSKVYVPRIWGEQIELRGSQVTWSGLGQEAPLKKKRVWDVGGSKRSLIVGRLKRFLPHYEIRINAMSSIDITKKGINKAYGVRKFSELSGIPIERMIYVGDALFPGGNDEVVKKTGIETFQVRSPRDTEKFISRNT